MTTLKKPQKVFASTYDPPLAAAAPIHRTLRRQMMAVNVCTTATMRSAIGLSISTATHPRRRPTALS
jgi:hypothetical protein